MGDETIDRVLHDLKVISAIRENDKIYTESGMLNLDHGGFYSSISRWARGENRYKGISAIGNIISDAFAISESGLRTLETRDKRCQDSREYKLMRLKSYHLVTKMRYAVADSLIGLKNLRSTYISDTSIAAAIDVLKMRVSQGLKELDASIEILKKELDIPDDISPRFSEFLVTENITALNDIDVESIC